jgi:hypothetical protein
LNFDDPFDESSLLALIIHFVQLCGDGSQLLLELVVLFKQFGLANGSNAYG